MNYFFTGIFSIFSIAWLSWADYTGFHCGGTSATAAQHLNYRYRPIINPYVSSSGGGGFGSGGFHK
jgi:hypothetical protein